MGAALQLWPEEIEALRPPELLTVSQWADRFRVLDEHTASEPGPWRTSRVPYLRKIQDSFSDPSVEIITFLKCTQVGGTEGGLNTIGYAIDQDPGPGMLVLPKDEAVTKFVEQRLDPMLRASKRLGDQIRDGRSNKTQLVIVFERMPLYFASAQTPYDMASVPCRYVWLEEPDKYPLFSGREADPRSLAWERTSTFPDRKLYEAGTPTLESGPIWQSWEESDRQHYQVPCPHCGKHQLLIFDQVKWPTEAHSDPERIIRENLAWYECAQCGDRIVEFHKRGMLERGVWVPEGAELLDDGTVKGAPVTTHVGFHVSALYSPWRTFSQVAAEFLRSKDDPRKLMNFVNSWLGLPWIEKATALTKTLIETLRADYAHATVPLEGRVLTCGVDVQASGVYYTVRAWGEAMRSWNVAHGMLPSLGLLEGLLLRTTWRRADGVLLPIVQTCIDSGYDANHVYEFCRAIGDICRPTKGYETLGAGGYFSASKIERLLDGKPFGITLWKLNTTLLKDRLAAFMHCDQGQPGSWAVPKDASPKYLEQLTSEHKQLIRNRATGATKQVWLKRTNATANHYWDAEVYALAAAEMLHLHVVIGGEQLPGGAAPPPRDDRERPPAVMPDEAPPIGRPKSNRKSFIGAGSKWLAGRKGWQIV